MLHHVQTSSILQARSAHGVNTHRLSQVIAQPLNHEIPKLLRAQVTGLAFVEAPPQWWVPWRQGEESPVPKPLAKRRWDWRVTLQLRLPAELFDDGPRTPLPAAAASDAADSASPDDGG